MPRKTLTIIGILLVLIQIIGVIPSWKTAFGIFVGLYLIVVAFRGSQTGEAGSELGNKSDANVFSSNDIKENMTSHNAKEIDKAN